MRWGVPAGVRLMALGAVLGTLLLAVLRHPEACGLVGESFLAAWRDDGYEYLYSAIQLLHGHGYLREGGPSAWREPLTSLYFAGCFALGGIRYAALLAGQSLLVYLSVLLCYRIGSQGFGPRAGVAAAALTATNVHLLRLSGIPYSETLSVLCLLASLACLFRSETRSDRRAWLVGAWLGLGVLSRGTLLLAMPVIAWTVWRMTRSRRQLSLYLLGFVVVLAPWIGRNAMLFHQIIPSAVRLPWVVWLDNTPSILHRPLSAPYLTGYPDAAEQRAMMVLASGQATITEWQAASRVHGEAGLETRVAAASRNLVIQSILASPGAYLRRSGLRLAMLYSPYIGTMSRSAQLAQSLKWLTLIVPGLWALWRWRREPWAGCILGITVGFSVVSTFVLLDEWQRYRVPIEPLLGIAAAVWLRSRVEPQEHEAA